MPTPTGVFKAAQPPGHRISTLNSYEKLYQKEGATMKQCKRHLTDREVFWLALVAAAVAWLLL